MAAFNLTNWHNVFETSLMNWLAHARPDIKQARIWSNFATEEVDLGVTYRLFSSTELYDAKPHQIQELFARKVHEILQTKKKTPKQITVERRRMLWRGECARKAKVKKK